MIIYLEGGPRVQYRGYEESETKKEEVSLTEGSLQRSLDGQQRPDCARAYRMLPKIISRKGSGVFIHWLLSPMFKLSSAL